uniref:Cyclic nucleotide-binding domain-containing protein n=1 Tax=Ditylum brightwellii TaxID=49249 RepID=A0A7S4RGH5_9STRA
MLQTRILHILSQRTGSTTIRHSILGNSNQQQLRFLLQNQSNSKYNALTRNASSSTSKQTTTNVVRNGTKNKLSNSIPKKKDNKNDKTSLMNSILDPTNPLMTKPITTDKSLSIAVLSGHTAFILTGLAYATSDVLHLRLLAMGGISLSMLFQYYRPQPLSIPLRWNSLFLAVNVIMVTQLYLERKEAEEFMGEELEDLFTVGLFEKRGFGRLEFWRLFRMARREELESGFYIKRVGEEVNKLYIITKGSATIERNGLKLQSISTYDTCGELELISHIDDDDDTTTIASVNVVVDETMHTQADNADDDSDSSDDDVVIGDVSSSSSSGAIAYVWDFEELTTFLAKQPSVKNALLAYVSHELKEKLTDSWELKLDPDTIDQVTRKEKEELANQFLHLMGAVSSDDVKINDGVENVQDLGNA